MIAYPTFLEILSTLTVSPNATEPFGPLITGIDAKLATAILFGLILFTPTMLLLLQTSSDVRGFVRYGRLPGLLVNTSDLISFGSDAITYPIPGHAVLGRLYSILSA